ncbi:MAG: restriction endonuclease [Ignavibacteriae bacterium]|nr:restriction endonuclease [Ignavibacteriota bacterium]
MTNVWCVRASGGKYTANYLKGGYAGVGADEIPFSLAHITSRDELYPLFKDAYSDVASPVVIGLWVGQMGRFLLEIQPGDYIITPAEDTEWFHYGLVQSAPLYIYWDGEDGCPYRHRRPVAWANDRKRRSEFSVPFQRTMTSMQSVFSVSQRDEFFQVIGRTDLVTTVSKSTYDPYAAVIEQILELDPTEFEILVGHLLTALGFEGSEVVGKTGDGGVDAIGELNASNLAKVKIFVQAKRYKQGTKISASAVRQLRQAIPFGGQGAFITTADFQSKAAEVATEQGFPRIGLINGRQLVDLLIEHWNDIPQDFQELLGLKPGLVLA